MALLVLLPATTGTRIIPPDLRAGGVGLVHAGGVRIESAIRYRDFYFTGAQYLSIEKQAQTMSTRIISFTAGVLRHWVGAPGFTEYQ